MATFTLEKWFLWVPCIIPFVLLALQVVWEDGELFVNMGVDKTAQNVTEPLGHVSIVQMDGTMGLTILNVNTDVMKTATFVTELLGLV